MTPRLAISSLAQGKQECAGPDLDNPADEYASFLLTAKKNDDLSKNLMCHNFRNHLFIKKKFKKFKLYFFLDTKTLKKEASSFLLEKSGPKKRLFVQNNQQCGPERKTRALNIGSAFQGTSNSAFLPFYFQRRVCV